ncbi:hypothetical protein [Paenibacillus bovis]|uniref:Uncharacterized protein n=1 Tax=Paenibacillus bovis TaxID=1616788 RepID=A0A172ZB62_9BACL|nr:hypothetical protein [Paenibacillus bovis]ANF94858.1 hypothetical protein AR543_01630 [Paenibacillus bovis]
MFTLQSVIRWNSDPAYLPVGEWLKHLSDPQDGCAQQMDSQQDTVEGLEIRIVSIMPDSWNTYGQVRIPAHMVPESGLQPGDVFTLWDQGDVGEVMLLEGPRFRLSPYPYLQEQDMEPKKEWDSWQPYRHMQLY